MSGTITQLENDLRTLANEAGRSLSAVREAAQIGLAKLTAARSEYASFADKVAQGEPVQGRLEDVFRPFLLACNHHNAPIKLVVVALSSIQRLLHADALGPDERLHVMHVLRIQAQREVRHYKDIEVKVVQTLPLLIMSKVHPVQEDLLLETVGLCCSIYDQDPGLASAALTQILTSVFERVEQAAKEDPTTLSPLQSRNLAQNSVSAMHLLEELTQIIERGAAGGSLPSRSASMASYGSSTSSGSSTGTSASGRISPFFRTGTSGRSGSAGPISGSEAIGAAGTHLASNSGGHTSLPDMDASRDPQRQQQFGAPSAIRRMPRSLALELLETILSNHASLFLLGDEAGPYANFVRTRICPVLERAFGGRCDWQLMVRMLRTVVVLLCELRTVIPAQDVKTLFKTLLDMLDDDPGASGLAKPRYVTPLWHRVLTLETLNILLSRQDLLGELQQIIMPIIDDLPKASHSSAVANSSSFAMAAVAAAEEDEAQATNGSAHSEPPRSVFICVVDALCKLVSVVVKDPNVAEGIDAIAARPTKGLDLLSEEAPPSNLSVSLVTLLAAECLASIADGMALSNCILSGGNNGSGGGAGGGGGSGASGSNSQPMVASVVHIGKVNSRRSDSASSPPLLAKKSSSLFLAGADDDSVGSGSPTLRLNTPELGKTRPPSDPADSVDVRDQIREDAMRRDTVREMMIICWEPMLRALALLLQSCNNENVVQFILKAYMSMTNTCGIVELVEARNAFILSLCNFSLPNWHSSAAIVPQQMSVLSRSGKELEPKHLQALKALFNIAHGLGSILGTAWHIVLETFEQLDHIMFCVAIEKKLTTSGTVHVTGMGPRPGDARHGPGGSSSAMSNESEWHLVDDEMAIVESMLRFLFNSTKYLDEDALIHIQTALTQLSFTVLAHTETMRTAAPTGSPSRSGTAHQRADSSAPTVLPSRLRQGESEGWISSTVMNFTNTLADAATATLTSVTYDGEEDPDGLASDDEGDMPDLGIDLTLEHHKDFHPSAHHDPAAGTHPSPRMPSGPRSSSLSTVPSLSNSRAGAPNDSSPSARGRNGRSLTPPARSSTPPSAMGTGLGTEAGVIDGFIARATYRNPPFAIEKLVETTKLNMFRIGLLWEMTQNVLSTVASKSDPKLRLYGVHAMEELVTSALLFEGGPNGEALSKDASNEASGSSREAKHGAESSYPPRSKSGLLAPVAPEASVQRGLGTNASSEASVPRPVKSIGRKGADGSAAVPTSYPPPSSLQVELIEGFAHLLRSHHIDAREATIQAMGRIIGTCGHLLGGGWRILIAELSRVTGVVKAKTDAESFSVPDYKRSDVERLVPTAFKSVQLIVDDFLPGLSLQHKKELALCICAFGQQEPHVNISLTSITMLWTMCDHVQRACPELAAAQKAGDTSADLAECNTLLLFCMEQLAVLSLDQRPEVRSCAVRTLCSIIVASAQKLTRDSWRTCTLGIVFPLLNEIIARGSQASSDQVHGEVLGRLSQKRAQVHHSLDTLEKQWRETIVTAIQGAARVVRACVQYSGGTNWSLKSWEIILETIRGVMIKHPPAKVGVACARSLQELGALVTGSSKARYAAVGMQVINGALVRVDNLSPAQLAAAEAASSMTSKSSIASSSSSSSSSAGKIPNGTLVLPAGTPVHELWTLVWDVYEGITARVDQAAEGRGGGGGGAATETTPTSGDPTTMSLSGVASAEVATELVNGICDLYSNNTGSGMLRSREVMTAVLDLIQRLLECFAARSKHLTSLERAVMRLVESLPPLEDAMWPIVFNVLRAFARGDSDGHGYSTGFADKSRELFVLHFERHAPSAARALVFEDTVREVLSLASGEVDNAVPEDGPAWDLASLQPIVKFGLRSLSTCGWAASRVQDIWISLLDMLHALMLGQARHTSQIFAKRVDIPTREALALLDVVMEEARPLVVASCVPSDVQAQLFNLLQSGCTLQDAWSGASKHAEGETNASVAAMDRLMIGRVCLDHLLTLSSYGSSGSSELSQQILMTLLHGVEQVVVTFFEESWEQRGAEDQARMEADAVAMLKKLRDVEFKEVPPMYLERFDRATLERCGSKAHLLLLLPILNRFVLVDNREVRQAIYEILEIVSNGLVSDRD
ncbi:Brefeldin A-inhibited guanine nucleotide-exchange protein 2 [Hondaea fermentalgiana]|uniref:Brefeldin A-inhibited guanine nucleotide-exchange protein 2 n=1 Tax=Hondaea fermentalgiana TaxID=2315210 RepID=A0A2R5GR20_9STRA|nr:Brefeldin A-inhibited guanine nucleotide-exchange protein 2 [Hondaea fermentalgiana]|eukprot:GBG33327.1 Brefeldin A-inhibited guanine nucleotide-exchange protein 2 [Hondaea fermentalgiana]